MSESTREKRNTVRVLFYGQSITAQWSKEIEAYLRKAYPFTNFIFGHLAIGGFEASNLVKIAPADINAFYPDLMIFHDYTRDPEPYEKIIQGTLENTSSDILILSDHIVKQEEIEEEAHLNDQNDLGLYGRHNMIFLPQLADRYGIEFCDIRGAWKRYLKLNNLPPQALLKDVVHLNEQGVFVMSELIKEHLRVSSTPQTDHHSEKVKTYYLGDEIKWKNNRIDLDFYGNRVDLIADQAGLPGSQLKVFIDEKAPSSLKGTTMFSRTSAYPGTWWPALPRITSDQIPVPEDWTLEIFDASDDLRNFSFRVTGSVTGPDGTGNSQEHFVSKSGRVVISPEDWERIVFARKMSKIPLPPEFKITWKAVPYHVDEYMPPKFVNPAIEAVTTVAQGFPNGRHRLSLLAPEGTEPPPLRAVRIFRPGI